MIGAETGQTPSQRHVAEANKGANMGSSDCDRDPVISQGCACPVYGSECGGIRSPHVHSVLIGLVCVPTDHSPSNKSVETPNFWLGTETQRALTLFAPASPFGESPSSRGRRRACDATLTGRTHDNGGDWLGHGNVRGRKHVGINQHTALQKGEHPPMRTNAADSDDWVGDREVSAMGEPVGWAN